MKMTRGRKIALGLSLAASMLAGAAYADQAAKGAEEHGGSITRAEAQAKAEEMFDRLDANHDGKLDQADRVARRNELFDRLDTNHDGQLSRAEFDAAAEHGPGGPEGGPGGPDGGPDGPGKHRWGGPGHMGRGHRGDGMMMMAMGRMADANHDGVITKAEFMAAAMQRFDQADTNHDGVVTREERQAAFKAMREQMRERWQHHAGEPGAPPPPPPSGAAN
jgi:Ca2+-binding EF-hand superfamily protein